ncbi:mandelate racemase/muconate lactonizing enzyme family protein [Alterinioella nitratireducens]|uniref:mandelate racemase/muconate lactonizing enzyme family protein n=1 Tax=Alterinioella nitratireducens TaxID=2735915 RepID=UPI00405A15FD
MTTTGPRITKVEAISLYVPIEDEIEAPVAVPHAEDLTRIIFSGYRTTLVRIETDDGVEGWGECMVRLAPTATRAIIEDIGSVLSGRDPLDREAIWELLFGVMMNRGHNRGMAVEAISGIDIALWDLSGRILGVPLYKLLGGRHHDRLAAYASSLRLRKMEEVVAQAQSFKERGFTAMKIKIGRNPDTPQVDIDFVAAIREAVGSEIRLMVDANCAYSENFKTALEVGRALQDLGIYWFEEPIAPNDLEGYKRLSSALDIRIAAGEADFMAFGSRDFFRSGAIDVVQPNISRTGGITEARRIAAMSRAFHIPYAPHTGSCSAVCLAATLQFAVSLPNFLIFEFMQSDWSKTQPNPLRHDLLKEPVEKLEDGHMVVPEGPGIGIEINMDVVDNYRMA